MSYITDVTIQDCLPRDIERINAWLLDADDRHGKGNGQQFREVDVENQAGGGKVFCSKTWCAAFNYGPMGELRAMLADPATWSIAGVKWIMDAEGDVVTMGLFMSPAVATMEFQTGGWNKERIAFGFGGRNTPYSEVHREEF